MNGASLSLAPLGTLADIVDETLADGLMVGAARCLWCGEMAVAVVADRWTGRVVLRCPACGTELEGPESHE